MPPLTVNSPGPPVEIWRDGSGAIHAYGEILGEECRVHVPGVASFSFTRQGDDVAAHADHNAETDLVLDAYRRKVLPMVVQARGREILHASGVRTPRGVVGFCGASQTGKSTIAFGLSRRGYELWSDDALAFDVSNGEPLAISLPFQVRLRPTAIELFGPRALADATPDSGELALPGSNVAPLAAVCVLRRIKEDTAITIRRLSFSEAFPAVFSHACWFTLHDSRDKRRVIDHYMDLVAEVPVFDVSFKSGLEHLSAILDATEQFVSDLSRDKP